MKKHSAFLLFITAIVASSCAKHESAPLKTPLGAKSTTASVVVPVSVPLVELPPAGEPLTDFSSCKVEVIGAPDTMKAGADPMIVNVTVTNSSTTAWPVIVPGKSSVIHAVNIAYHINQGKDPKKNWIIEGQHFSLPRSLEPGGTATVDVQIAPPTKAGSYMLYIEPVQEAVSWFGNKDGCAYSHPLKVN